MSCAGDAPVCDPKTFYECAIVSLYDYMGNNKAALCHCPRQCRHLSYNHDISQALISNHLVKHSMIIAGSNLTRDEFRTDYCLLEVSRMLSFHTRTRIRRLSDHPCRHVDQSSRMHLRRQTLYSCLTAKIRPNNSFIM